MIEIGTDNRQSERLPISMSMAYDDITTCREAEGQSTHLQISLIRRYRQAAL